MIFLNPDIIKGMKQKGLRRLLIFFVTAAWLLSGWPQVWHNPPIPPKIREVQAITTDLIVTACDVGNASNADCYNAVSADGGTSYALTKGGHIDAPFQTLSASAVASSTLYYDSWATLSGSWAIYVKDARDGTTICSVDPAPEDGSETANNVSCSITTTQLSNGVWLQVDNNDDKGPESVNLDYVRLYVDYTPPPAVSISITTDGSVAFETIALEATQDTTAGGINDVETISVDSGPADLDVRSTNFTEGGNTWTLNTANGANQVKWEFSKNGTDWSTFAVVDTLYALDTNVAQGQTRDLYLRITMPTSTNSYNQYSSTVTVVASAP